jgi:methionyl-tRNA formyltransferase
MDPRIIFMGTSYFSVLSLEKLLKNKYNVIGVVTITDRFSIRNKRFFVESAVKKYARLHALPILQSDGLKDSICLDILKKWHTEIIIIIAFRMLPKIVWELPKFGSFNLHPSLLPNYRGAAPIQWVIKNGEPETGLSIFQVNEKVDMGMILLQNKISIEKKENAGYLSIRLSEIGAYLVIDALKISNCIFRAVTKQPTNFQFKMAPKLLRYNSKINWKETIKDIYNNIRGTSPTPGAWCILADNLIKKKEFKIYRADYRFENHYKNVGNVEENKIAVNEGYIFILECKLEGKHPLLIIKKKLIDKN